MYDRLEEIGFYKTSRLLWKLCWEDTAILRKDFQGMEIARQLIRSVGSVSANIEEGYGRGFGKEYPQYLRISRGSARESKGWYERSEKLLTADVIQRRVMLLDQIITALNKSINTLQSK